MNRLFYFLFYMRTQRETVFSKVWQQVTTIDYNLKVVVVIKQKLCKIDGNVMLKKLKLVFYYNVFSLNYFLIILKSFD